MAQVGIGNTDPKANLDITASNSVTPLNTDGILIPKIDNFSATNPTIDQDGMLVFVTGNGTPTKGFYYWDNALISWVLSTGAKQINDLTDGKSDNDGSNNGSSIFLGVNSGQNDDQTNNNNVGIGLNSMLNNTSGHYNVALGFQSSFFNSTGLFNTAIGTQSLLYNTASFNTGLGTYALYNNTTGQNNTSLGYSALNTIDIGSNNTAIGSNAGFGVTGNSANNIFIGYNSGYRVPFSPISGSIFIGTAAGYNELNNNRLYIENSNANSDNALIYGEFDTNILRTNGEFQIGNPTTTGYAFPTSDGLVGQILTSDGLGNISFETPVLGAQQINDLIDGKSDVSSTGPSVFLGTNAGSNDDGNNYNTGIGIDALYNNITGDGNTANGYRSLYNNISGTSNSANGINALYHNTTGFYNTANGSFAMYLNTTGSSNVANGGSALYFNTTGNTNTANGTNALASNSIGSSNTATGSGALLDNDIGNYNTANGVNSLESNTNGNYNTASGYRALFSNSTGSSNTAFGFESGYYNTSQSSIFLGYRAGYFENGGNKLYIENSNADADNALVYGEFDNDIFRINGQLQVGNPTLNGYALPTTDGTNGQVMTTDGIGNITFQNATIDTDNQTIDNLGLSGTILGISLENDGVAPITIDLAPLQDADWFEVGSTNPPNSITDNKYTNGSLSIGKNTIATGKVDIENTDQVTTLKLLNTYDPPSISSPKFGIQNTINSTEQNTAIQNELSGDSSSKSGVQNLFYGNMTNGLATGVSNHFATTGSNNQIAVYNTFASTLSTGSVITGVRNWFQNGSNYTGNLDGIKNDFNNDNNGVHTAILNTFTGTGNGIKYGIRTIYSGIANGTFYGNYTELTNTGIGNKYGNYISILNTSGGTHYGLYSDVTKTNSYAGYFLGRVAIGTTAGNNYILPNFRGTNGQIMQSDGTGNVTWQDPNTGTDNQQIDTFNFNTSTNQLTLEIQNDGQPAQIVDLSSLSPQKAIARVFMNASQTETGGGITKVNFDTTEFDIGNNFNATTDEYTVPLTGVYRITTQITMDASTGTGTFDVRIRINGAQQRRTEYNHTGNGQVVRQVSSLLSLTGGDIVDVAFSRPAIGATIQANSRVSFFEIEQIE